MKRLDNKVAIVTGASKGIGASIANAFGAEGAAVVVNYARDHEGAERVVREITGKGGRAIAVQGDVAQRSDAKRLLAEAKRAFGRLDVLVNNAGASRFLAEERRNRQRPLRRIHRQERGRCQGQLQGGDRRGSYFKQGTEPSARMACRLLRGKHRRPGRMQHRDCL
jgi:3-oxoacyl-[acyl-carrier protein] reductase